VTGAATKGSPKAGTKSPLRMRGAGKGAGRLSKLPDDDINATPAALQDRIKARKWNDMYDELPDATKTLYDKASYETCIARHI
jgi:hypothetical protein